MEAKARADALLDAHVAFELARLRRGATHEWLEQVWRWAEGVALRDVLAPDALSDWLALITVDIVLPEDFEARAGRFIDDLVRLSAHREAAVADVVDRAVFDDVVAAIVALEGLRYRLIQHLSNSPLAATVAGDVLHQGIKDFALSDAGGLAALPGVGSLLRGSSELFGRRMPRLEAELDNRIRAYIAENTARTLARSEARLVETLDREAIEAIADRVWADLSARSLSIAELVDADELQIIVDAALGVWRGVRATGYWRALIDEAVTAYYARFGDEPLAESLAALGLTRGELEASAATLAPALVDGLDRTGLLEALIRARLAPFYRSPAFAAALSADQAPGS